MYEVERIVSVEQIKTCQKLLHSEDAHLPLVVFSQIKEVPQSPSIADISKTAPFRSTALPSLPNLPVKGKPSASDPPYDMISFARSGVALCRTYLLEENLRERFNRAMNCNINPGDVGVFEPRAFGNYAKVYPFKPSNVRQEETMASLRTVMYQYPRKKEISFGRIIFLSAARESLLHLTRESKAEALTVYDHWAQKVQMLETYWAAAVGEKDAEISGLSEHLSRQKQYVARLEEEKEVLRGECAETLDRLKGTITARDEEIAYLRRKINQPKSHSKVANWVETTFSDRLILHARAAELLEEKSARSVSIELICDALDFLATDYWDRRYTRISSDEMFTRCSQKYGHPFEVKPTGKTTIEFTPNEYKIKYYTNTQGKLIDSNLDYHLGVGNDPENLLRIYFLHDDERKLIVVGSLPRHLRSVTIK